MYEELANAKILVDANALVAGFVHSGLLDKAKCGEVLELIKRCSEIQREWIPISERFPGCGQRVLTSGMIHPFDERCKIRIATFYDGHFWPVSDDMQILSGVRAWMPLPEPYKAESEDKG